MARRPRLARGVGLAALCAGLAACAAPAPRIIEDRSLATLDRLLEQPPPTSADPATADQCVAELDVEGLCAEDAETTRTVGIQLALDPRYTTKWAGWRQRLDATLGCVNRLYATTGVQWRIAAIDDWDPADARHELYALLHRLQRETARRPDTVLLGITVWDEDRIFRKAGGEIGLSQRSACVVPSWPRVENDCVILAHELGHLIGAKHVPGKQWIMGWAARPFYLPAQDPLARVVATYRFHPRNSAAITAYKTARITPRGLRPTAECRQRLARIDACWN